MTVVISCKTISTQMEVEESLTTLQFNLSCSIQSFFSEATSCSALFSLAAGQGVASLVQAKGYRLCSSFFSPKAAMIFSKGASYITEGVSFNVASELGRSGEFKLGEFGETVHGISTIILCKSMGRNVLGQNALIQNLLQNSALMILDIGFEKCGFIEQKNFCLIERYAHCQITSFRMEISANLLAITCPQVGVLKATQELDYEIQSLKNSKNLSENKNGKSNNFLEGLFSPKWAGNNGEVLRDQSFQQEIEAFSKSEDLLCRAEQWDRSEPYRKQTISLDLEDQQKLLLEEPLKLIPPTARKLLLKDNVKVSQILKGIWITLYAKIHYLREVKDKKDLKEAFQVATFIYMQKSSHAYIKAYLRIGERIFFDEVPDHESYFYPFHSNGFQSLPATKELANDSWVSPAKTAEMLRKAQQTMDIGTFLSLKKTTLYSIHEIWKKYETDLEAEKGFLGFVQWAIAEKETQKIEPSTSIPLFKLAIDFFPIREQLRTVYAEFLLQPSKSLPSRISELEKQLMKRAQNLGVAGNILPIANPLLLAMAKADVDFKYLQHHTSNGFSEIVDKLFIPSSNEERISSPEIILQIKELLEDRGVEFDATTFFVSLHPQLKEMFPALSKPKPCIQITLEELDLLKEFDLGLTIFKWRKMQKNDIRKIESIEGIPTSTLIQYENRQSSPKDAKTLNKLIDLIASEKSNRWKNIIYLAVQYEIFTIVPIEVIKAEGERIRLTSEEIWKLQDICRQNLGHQKDISSTKLPVPDRKIKRWEKLSKPLSDHQRPGIEIIQPRTVISEINRVLKKKKADWLKSDQLAELSAFLKKLFPTLDSPSPFIHLTRDQFEQAKSFDLAYALFNYRMESIEKTKVTFQRIGKIIGVHHTDVCRYEDRSSYPRNIKTLIKLIEFLCNEEIQNSKEAMTLAVFYPISSVVPLVILEPNGQSHQADSKEIEVFQQRILERHSRHHPPPVFYYFLGTDQNGKLKFPSNAELDQLHNIPTHCSKKLSGYKGDGFHLLSYEKRWTYYLFDLALQKFGSSKKAALEIGIQSLDYPTHLYRDIAGRLWQDQKIANYVKKVGLTFEKRRETYLFFKETYFRNMAVQKGAQSEKEDSFSKEDLEKDSITDPQKKSVILLKDNFSEEEKVRLRKFEQVLVRRKAKKSTLQDISIPAQLLIESMAKANIDFSHLRRETKIDIDYFIDETCSELDNGLIHPPGMILRIQRAFEERKVFFNAAQFYALIHPNIGNLFPTARGEYAHLELTREEFEEARNYDLAYSIFAWRMKGGETGKPIFPKEGSKKVGVSNTIFIDYEMRRVVPKKDPLLMKLIDVITETTTATSRERKKIIYLAIRYEISSILPIFILESNKKKVKLEKEEIEQFQKQRRERSSYSQVPVSYRYFLGTDETGKVLFPSLESIDMIDESLYCSEKVLNLPYQKKKQWSSLSREEKWTYYLYNLAIEKFGTSEAAVQQTGLSYLEKPSSIKKGVIEREWKNETIAEYTQKLQLNDAERRRIFIFFREKELRELLKKQINA